MTAVLLMITKKKTVFEAPAAEATEADVVIVVRRSSMDLTGDRCSSSIKTNRIKP